MRTGSLVASSVVGEDEKNGGLWCSPIANTSRPTSSVFCAIWVIASIRSASLGVSPDTGSRVMSLTEKIPNCMVLASDICVCMYLNHRRRRGIPDVYHGGSRTRGGLMDLSQLQ